MMADGVAHQLIVGLIVGRWFIDADVQSFDSGYAVTTALKNALGRPAAAGPASVGWVIR